MIEGKKSNVCLFTLCQTLSSLKLLSLSLCSSEQSLAGVPERLQSGSSRQGVNQGVWGARVWVKSDTYSTKEMRWLQTALPQLWHALGRQWGWRAHVRVPLGGLPWPGHSRAGTRVWRLAPARGSLSGVTHPADLSGVPLVPPTQSSTHRQPVFLTAVCFTVGLGDSHSFLSALSLISVVSTAAQQLQAGTSHYHAEFYSEWVIEALQCVLEPGGRISAAAKALTAAQREPWEPCPAWGKAVSAHGPGELNVLPFARRTRGTARTGPASLSALWQGGCMEWIASAMLWLFGRGGGPLSCRLKRLNSYRQRLSWRTLGFFCSFSSFIRIFTNVIPIPC